MIMHYSRGVSITFYRKKLLDTKKISEYHTGMAKNRIKEMRLKRGLNAQNLAVKVGCSEKSINNYESERHAIPLFLARRIARVLSVSLSKLFPETP